MAERVERVNIKVETLEHLISLLEDGNVEEALGILRFASRAELRRIMRADQRKCYLEMRTALRRKQYDKVREYEAQLKAYEKYFL